MIVLGINAFHGDASAALLKDGKIIAAVAEERFTRIKHEGGFPKNAIQWCLHQAEETVDAVAISRDPAANRARKIVAVLKNPLLISAMPQRIINAEHIFNIEKKIYPLLRNKVKIIRVEHHLAHMAYAYATSGFKKCALLSVDGFGDFVSTAWGGGIDGKIEISNKIYYPHSLGMVYSAITQFLGFDRYGEEYKVMALASYGKPRYIAEFKKIIWQVNDGFKIAKKYFTHVQSGVNMTFGAGTPKIGGLYQKNLISIFGPARQRGEVLTIRHFDIAASLQKITTDIILHLAVLAQRESDSDFLAISGGVGLNSVSNGALADSNIFREIWFPCAPADDGTAVGAAAAVALKNGERFEKINNRDPFLGPAYENEGKFNDGISLPFEELLEKITNLLVNGKIIGWFEGRMEFGPRALGHRSILADPSSIAMREKINRIVKKREVFRPFAPIVLFEDVAKYFLTDKSSPNMMTVVSVRGEWRSKLAAVTHVDGTARVQTVTAEENSTMARLLKLWKEKSGHSVLLNTSFNEDEPIVTTPREAYACYARTAIDALVLNGQLYIK